MDKPISQQAARQMLNALRFIAHVYDDYKVKIDDLDMLHVRKAIAIAEYDMSLNDTPRVVIPETMEVAP